MTNEKRKEIHSKVLETGRMYTSDAAYMTFAEQCAHGLYGCEVTNCAFNNNGFCRYSMVEDCPPAITKNGICASYVYAG